MAWQYIAAAGLSLLGGAMAASAARKQAQAQQNQAYMNAMLRELENAQIKEAAAKEAALIRFRASRYRGSQIAQQANAGVVIGEGSAQAVIDDTQALAEADALVVAYNGIAGIQSNSAAARFERMAGDNAISAGRDRAYASLLSGVSGAVQSYSTYKALTTTK